MNYCDAFITTTLDCEEHLICPDLSPDFHLYPLPLSSNNSDYFSDEDDLIKQEYIETHIPLASTREWSNFLESSAGISNYFENVAITDDEVKILSFDVQEINFHQNDNDCKNISHEAAPGVPALSQTSIGLVTFSENKSRKWARLYNNSIDVPVTAAKTIGKLGGVCDNFSASEIYALGKNEAIIGLVARASLNSSYHASHITSEFQFEPTKHELNKDVHATNRDDKFQSASFSTKNASNHHITCSKVDDVFDYLHFSRKLATFEDIDEIGYGSAPTISYIAKKSVLEGTFDIATSSEGFHNFENSESCPLQHDEFFLQQALSDLQNCIHEDSVSQRLSIEKNRLIALRQEKMNHIENQVSEQLNSIIIQGSWRKFKAKRYYLSLLNEKHVANIEASRKFSNSVKIQAFWRGYHGRKYMLPLLKARLVEKKILNTIKIQSFWRRRKNEKYVQSLLRLRQIAQREQKFMHEEDQLSLQASYLYADEIIRRKANAETKHMSEADQESRKLHIEYTRSKFECTLMSQAELESLAMATFERSCKCECALIEIAELESQNKCLVEQCRYAKLTPLQKTVIGVTLGSNFNFTIEKNEHPKIEMQMYESAESQVAKLLENRQMLYAKMIPNTEKTYKLKLEVSSPKKIRNKSENNKASGRDYMNSSCIHRSMIAHLGPLRSISKLDLSVEGLSSIGYSLSECSNLRSLSLNVNRLESISGLESCNSIEILSVRDNCIRTLSGISTLTNLLVLHMDVNHLKSLVNMPNMPNLIELTVSTNRIEGLPTVFPLPVIQQLDMQHNCLKSIPKLCFSSVPVLLYLNLSRNLIGNDKELGITLSFCPSICTLLLSQCGFTRFPSLKLPILKELWLNGNRMKSVLDDETSVWLPSLCTLYLQDNELEKICTNKLELAVSCPILTKLDLSFNMLEDHKLLLNSLKMLYSLRWLDIRDNPWTNFDNWSAEIILNMPFLQNFNGEELSFQDLNAALEEKLKSKSHIVIPYLNSVQSRDLLFKPYFQVESNRESTRNQIRFELSLNWLDVLNFTEKRTNLSCLNKCSNENEVQSSMSNFRRKCAESQARSLEMTALQRKEMSREEVNEFEHSSSMQVANRVELLKRHAEERAKEICAQLEIHQQLPPFRNEEYIFIKHVEPKKSAILCHDTKKNLNAILKIQKWIKINFRRISLKRAEAEAKALNGKKAAIKVQSTFRGFHIRRSLYAALESAKYIDEELNDIVELDVDSYIGHIPNFSDSVQSHRRASKQCSNVAKQIFTQSQQAEEHSGTLYANNELHADIKPEPTKLVKHSISNDWGLSSIKTVRSLLARRQRMLKFESEKDIRMKKQDPTFRLQAFSRNAPISGSNKAIISNSSQYRGSVKAKEKIPLSKVLLDFNREKNM